MFFPDSVRSADNLLADQPLGEVLPHRFLIAPSVLLRLIDYEGPYNDPNVVPDQPVAVDMPELMSTEASGRLSVIGNTAMRQLARLRLRLIG